MSLTVAGMHYGWDTSGKTSGTLSVRLSDGSNREYKEFEMTMRKINAFCKMTGDEFSDASILSVLNTEAAE